MATKVEGDIDRYGCSLGGSLGGQDELVVVMRMFLAIWM